MKKALILFFLTLVTALHANRLEWPLFKEKVLPELAHIDGWCSREKALNMMDLIHRTRPQLCVEIGVFGGSSIYPTACALSYLKCGFVYAIDPWNKENCTERFMPGNEHFEWWSQVDLEKIYSNFINMLKRNHLQHYCYVMRMTSEQACHYFIDGSIDILHIDGNHSEESAYRDAILYLPKVKSGGYIWFDDVDWKGTTKAVEFLSDYCDMIPEMFVGECILFKKR